MIHDESETLSRVQLVNATIQAYLDLFLMMQSVTVAHWMSLELTFTQGKALILLAGHKSLTVSQLAKLLGVGKPTASILVQQLVERGLVTRSEDEFDRRHTIVRLSEHGAELGAGRRKERELQWQGWISQLSDEELSALARGMSALRDVVQAEAGIMTH